MLMDATGIFDFFKKDKRASSEPSVDAYTGIAWE